MTRLSEKRDVRDALVNYLIGIEGNNLRHRADGDWVLRLLESPYRTYSLLD